MNVQLSVRIRQFFNFICGTLLTKLRKPHTELGIFTITTVELILRHKILEEILSRLFENPSLARAVLSTGLLVFCIIAAIAVFRTAPRAGTMAVMGCIGASSFAAQSMLGVASWPNDSGSHDHRTDIVGHVLVGSQPVPGALVTLPDTQPIQSDETGSFRAESTKDEHSLQLIVTVGGRTVPFVCEIPEKTNSVALALQLETHKCEKFPVGGLK